MFITAVMKMQIVGFTTTLINNAFSLLLSVFTAAPWFTATVHLLGLWIIITNWEFGKPQYSDHWHQITPISILSAIENLQTHTKHLHTLPPPKKTPNTLLKVSYKQSQMPCLKKSLYWEILHWNYLIEEISL